MSLGSAGRRRRSAVCAKTTNVSCWRRAAVYGPIGRFATVRSGMAMPKSGRSSGGQSARRQ